jgi:hypothetical protein
MCARGYVYTVYQVKESPVSTLHYWYQVPDHNVVLRDGNPCNVELFSRASLEISHSDRPEVHRYHFHTSIPGSTLLKHSFECSLLIDSILLPFLTESFRRFLIRRGRGNSNLLLLRVHQHWFELRTGSTASAPGVPCRLKA